MAGAIACVFLFFVFSSAVYANPFYFAAAGSTSSSNPCTTQASPCDAFVRFPAVFEAQAGPGVQFLFKRGDTFTNPAGGYITLNTESGAEGNPIIIGAYGSGNRPHFAYPLNQVANQLQFNIYSVHHVHFRDITSHYGKGLVDLHGCTNWLLTNWEVYGCRFACMHVGRLYDNQAGNESRFITYRNFRIVTEQFTSTQSTGDTSHSRREAFYLGTDGSKTDIPDTTGDITIENFEVTGTSEEEEVFDKKPGVGTVTIRNGWIHDTGGQANGMLYAPRGPAGYPDGLLTVENVRVSNIPSIFGPTYNNLAAFHIDGFSATLRNNIIADHQGSGICIRNTNNHSPPPTRIITNNTTYSNGNSVASPKCGDQGIFEGGASDTTKQNNIERENISNNDTIDPQFVAISNDQNGLNDNYRLSSSSTRKNDGALVRVQITSMTIPTTGATLQVQTIPNVSPLSNCAGSTVTLSCTGGAVTTTSCSSAGTVATYALSRTIHKSSVETCTGSMAAGQIFDSANVGGPFFTAQPKNGTNELYPATSVINNSVQGEEIAENLLTIDTFATDDGTPWAVNRDWKLLLGGLIGGENDSAYAPGTNQGAVMEWCFPTPHDISRVEMRGDNSGNAKCLLMDIKYRTTIGGSLTTLVNDADCLFDKSVLLTFPLNQVGVTCLRFECTGGPGGFQAYRLLALGEETEGPPPSEEPRLLTITGTMNGCMGAC